MKHHGASMPCPQLSKHGSILGLGTTRSPVLQRSKGDLVVPILCSCVSSTGWGSVASDKDEATQKKTTDSQNLTDHYWTWLNTKAGADLPQSSPPQGRCLAAAKPAKEWQLKQLKQLREANNPPCLGHGRSKSSCGQILSRLSGFSSKHRANRVQPVQVPSLKAVELYGQSSQDTGQNVHLAKITAARKASKVTTWNTWRLLLAQSVLASMFLHKDDRTAIHRQTKR